MLIRLERFAYTTSCTRGILHLGTTVLQTIERPWVKNPDGLGGLPFESCIPDGDYELQPYTRPSGKKAFILSNPDRGVYRQREDMGGKVGRYLILIHVGNTVKDVVGCIAPGLSGSDKFVGDSRKAMAKLQQELGSSAHTIVIGPKGTES